ncbi:GFA family protein [Pseudodonghicola xiamenensis]|uniref:CENP-V/GFA domain-containing protein n=1 Tax=Pseudodonghicola xiamenensis TaxID=337702 RepID=A0A8J3MBH1_9RHOB|nr:GFA family protein [Pseudodonghicola xiamenensis]GHG80166.1 hypothetical protein GCM10010961_03070 [Pseudodonghicola xiamenensis]
MTGITGGCLCGDIQITLSGPPRRVGICHCLACRKHHGAVFYAAAVFPRAAVAITGSPRHYQGRFFCPRCGSSVFSTSDDEIEVHLGALDTPDRFVPSYELWVSRRESWLRPVAGARQFTGNRVAGNDDI